MSVMLSPLRRIRPDKSEYHWQMAATGNAPSSRRGFASFTKTSAASSITTFINSSKPYKNVKLARVQRMRIHKQNELEIWHEINPYWTWCGPRRLRTIIRPSILISMLSYSHITTFVLCRNKSTLADRYGSKSKHLLQVLEDDILYRTVS